MKTARILFFFLFAFLLLFLSTKPASAETNLFKPELTWQRSTEASGSVIYESDIGTKVQEALQLPLDPGQTVFDNGTFTPSVNKNAVPASVQWASWPQYSYQFFPCGPAKELRHLQARFNLQGLDISKVKKVKLISPYYPNDYFPINDNAYIFINNNFIDARGIQYFNAINLGQNGGAQYANETDGWVTSGNFDTIPIQYLTSGENIIDIAAGEICRWGGMGKLELVLEIEGPIPTPSPSPSPGPQPFLDLPWDYQGQGKSFEQVALDPFSWFDHEYPLQNIPCCVQQVMKYTGETKNDFYRSHNGYDYASQNGVFLDTPVLAAASGWATFVSPANSNGSGNIIKVDHENGYQTWYEHLSNDDLIIDSEGERAFVNQGQQIGRVGMTGNTTGPHIHFSVFKDTNGAGSFDDEIPLGATDPLGWEGESGQDPWPKDMNGAPSHNLFIVREAPKEENIPISGGSISNDKITVDIPEGASSTQLRVKLQNGPFEKISNFITSIVPSFFLNAFDNNGQQVAEFSEPINISYNYSQADLANVNEDSLKLYTFNEQTFNWEELATVIDKINKTASAQTSHLSQFALMGEVKDLVAPTTEIIINGDKGQENWYRSNVSVELFGKDNEGGIGLQYTLYTMNGNDWFEYSQPLIFTEEGHYSIIYQSFDKAENTEDRKTIEFNIDKIPPEAKIYIDQTKKDLVVEGVDDNQTEIEQINFNGKKAIYIVSDSAGNKLVMDVRDFDKKKLDKFKVYSLTYLQENSQTQPDNLYRVIYQGKGSQISVKEEYFQLAGVIKIKIKYDVKSNKSSIYTSQGKKLKLNEERNGLVLLQLQTNQGNLEYSY